MVTTEASSAGTEPSRSKQIAGTALIAAQLAGVVLLFHLFRLETEPARQVARLALGGFLLHALLPPRWRLAGFAALSLIGVGLVLGWRDGAWLVGAGLLLIGVCHLPLRLWMRAALLLLAGVALTLLRSPAPMPGGAGSWTAPWSAAVWPVLGSMFMFRLIVYLHDLEHEPVRPRLARSLSYFFMLPNVCFPLFPVVDYKSFRSGYRSLAPLPLRQRGVDWMLRGVLHLLVYRLVYNHLILSPSEVGSFATLMQFLVANIFLYVRISGQFHIIVGMLCLFGFDLPVTNRLYFLAGSFNDYWRRINIYWKEFMLKVVYWPAFLRLKRLGKVPAMALATALVFLASWLLHSYQWFWLQGRFPLRSPDALFWGTVGLLVLINSLYESRRRQRRSLTGRSWTAAGGATHALRILGTFTVIAVLWSLWTSDSLAEWLSLWQAAAEFTRARDLLWLLLAIAAVAALGAAAGWIAHRRAGIVTPRRLPRAAVTAAWIGLLSLLPLPWNRHLGPRAAEFIAGLRQTQLSSRDTERLVQGYYEGLLAPVRLESELATRAIAEPTAASADADRENFNWRRDFLWVEIRPLRRSTYLGKPFLSNRWGMRDREYEKSRPVGTRRIALLGASETMGQGVGNQETFETLLEDRLNREGLRRNKGPFEILNFAVADHSFLQQLVLLEERVLEFDPDVVVYVAHGSESQWLRRHLGRVAENRLDLRYPFLERALERAGVTPGMGSSRSDRLLMPVQQEVLEWAYQRFVDLCREKDVVPVWVLLPRLDRNVQALQFAGLHDLAERVGFLAFRLRHLYTGRSQSGLAVSATDLHLNPKGHQLVAAAMYHRLRQNAVELGLAEPAGPARETKAAREKKATNDGS